MRGPGKLSFVLRERDRQIAFFNETLPHRQHYLGAPNRLVTGERALNLAPGIREAVVAYFGNEITWHTHANHALSSQVCCLNFLAPLAADKERLSALVGHALGIVAPEMLPVDPRPRPDGKHWYVEFEWNGGGKDFLNESRHGKPLPRGSNSTSTDAVVRFQHGGRTELLLIEWKYTEQYGAPLASKNRTSDGKTGTSNSNETRTKRYAKIAFAPDGPIRSDLGLKLDDFFYEPFYQLLRQQMLAFQLQKSPDDKVSRVRVLHISPSGNRALHRITSPALRKFGSDDAFEVFRDKLLVRPDDFEYRNTEALFGPLLAAAPPGDPWASYLTSRYGFLTDRIDGTG
jgi:hypothetical protein